jgi:hypothetical protein
MSSVTVTTGGQTVTSVVSDPVNQAVYTFTGGNVTSTPQIGYGLGLSNYSGYQNATITQTPFTVTFPDNQPPETIYNVVLSNSDQFLNDCDPQASAGAWYLEFTFNMSNIVQGVIANDGQAQLYRCNLGLADYHVADIICGADQGNLYLMTGPTNLGGVPYPMPIMLNPQSPVSTFRFQFSRGTVSLIVDNITLATERVAAYSKQYVVFSVGHSDAIDPANNEVYPLTILSNIVLGLPTRTFTNPPLQFSNSSSELLPYLSNTSSNVVEFTTPSSLLLGGLDPSTIVIDQVYGGAVLATAPFVVSNVGTLPVVSIQATPAFTQFTRIRDFVPFFYQFYTTLYYPPADSAQTYKSVGGTPVIITGLDVATVTLPAGFTDVQVYGDRLYDSNTMYVKGTQLSFDIPYFSAPFSTAEFGLVGNLGLRLFPTISGGGSGSNTISLSSTSFTYTSSRRLVYALSPVPPFNAIGFHMYLVDPTYGTSNLLGAFLPSPDTTYSMFMLVQSASGYAGSSITAAFRGPPNRQIYAPTTVPVVLDPLASGTTFLRDYTDGEGTQTMNVSSAVGFSTVTVAPYLWKVNAVNKGVVVASIQTLLTILQGTVLSVPEINTSTIFKYIYTPFSYVFSLSNSPNSTLIYYNSDPVIRPYITANYNSSVITFASTVGFTSAFSNGLLSIQAIGSDGGLIATTNVFFTVSSNIITSSPPFAGNITLYKYEPFSYAYSLVPGVVGLTLSPAASSAEVRTFTQVAGGARSLTYAGTYNSSYANIINLIVSAVDSSNVTITSLSNAVTVNPGRFSNPVNTSFSFYQYEDVSLTYGSNIAFDTAASLDNPPASTPSLPTGLLFASVAGSSNNFVLKGIPQFQTPSNKYLVLGVNSVTNQTVSTRISIVVNPPRIKITPPSLSVSGMQIGVPIQPVTFTSIQPSALTIINFQYGWDALPDGLVFQDLNGSNVSQPFYPSDPNLSIVLAGTPTSNAAYAFANSGSTVYTVNLYTFQYQPKGVRTDQKAPIQFSFGETILFTNTAVPKLYATQALTRTTLIFRAQSYFPTLDPITSIVVSSLPDGLSIVNTITGIPNYVNGYDYKDGVFVFGTPTTVSSASYLVTATSLNGYTGSINLLIPILPDIVSFTSVTPASAVFIVSRPITLDYNLVFTAVSVIIDQTITYTTSFDLAPYGLSLSVANGSATLVGTPTQPLVATTLVITATDTLGTFATVPIQLTINPDQFTFNSPVLNFIQHVPIAPVQFSATTTSKRQVISFVSSDLPRGLSLSTLGNLTGTPSNSTSGNFHITASTGYAVGGTGNFAFTMVADNILTLLTANPLTIPSRVFSVDAFRSFTYSGHTATVSVVQSSIKDKNNNDGTPYVSLSTTGTYLNGTFATGAEAYSPFSFNLLATYLNTTATLPLQLYYNGTTGSLTTNVSAGTLRFTSPVSLVYLFYQHCPIPSITFSISGATGFTYFYTVAGNLPIGLVFTPDPTGTLVTISGTPAIYNDALQSVTVYAVNDGHIAFQTIQIRVITPYFVNPQDNGASAYTSILQNQVIVNAAQNARDTVVFPATDASLGFLQSPGAPDVKSPPVPCCDVKIK